MTLPLEGDFFFCYSDRDMVLENSFVALYNSLHQITLSRIPFAFLRKGKVNSLFAILHLTMFDYFRSSSLAFLFSDILGREKWQLQIAFQRVCMGLRCHLMNDMHVFSNNSCKINWSSLVNLLIYLRNRIPIHCLPSGNSPRYIFFLKCAPAWLHGGAFTDSWEIAEHLTYI